MSHLHKKIEMKKIMPGWCRKVSVLVVLLLAFSGGTYADDDVRAKLLQEFEIAAKEDNPDFQQFSTERGKTLFYTEFGTGKKDTPACTSCHTDDPAGTGKTRAGKAIKPMAVSANPKRYIDRKKVAKWFRRNCKGVLGRECTPLEKGDFLAYMYSL